MTKNMNFLYKQKRVLKDRYKTSGSGYCVYLKTWGFGERTRSEGMFLL